MLDIPQQNPLKYGFSGIEVNIHSTSQHVYETKPEKIGLIYTKDTYSYYGANLLFCICYIKSVSFIEFPTDCVYDEIFITIVRKYKNCYILKSQNKATFYV